MKTNKIFGFLVATTIALLAIGTVMAGSLNVNLNQVQINGITVGDGNTIAASAGQAIPIQVQFTPGTNLSDVQVEAQVDGYSSDVSASTNRFDVLSGSTYTETLDVQLPSVTQMSEDLNQGVTLYLTISDQSDQSETSYPISLQRSTYSLDILSAEMPSQASAGEIVGVNVVLKNTGTETATDNFVTASIPDLGISQKAYFGDLQAQDDLNQNDNSVDAKDGTIYLTIPSNALTGDYKVQVTASDYDTTSSLQKIISITGAAVATNSTNSTAIAVASASSSGSSGIPTSIIVLTVVLVIIFVVLLVVLIVLLTKKPTERVEDFGETSYY